MVLVVGMDAQSQATIVRRGVSFRSRGFEKRSSE